MDPTDDLIAQILKPERQEPDRELDQLAHQEKARAWRFGVLAVMPLTDRPDSY